jgi:hypothetical protein
MMRNESIVSSIHDNGPISARSSHHPGTVDESYQSEDGESYDPNMALLRAPNENFKVNFLHSP